MLILYLMTGDSDYMLRVVVADVPALQGFVVDRLIKIAGVSNIRSSFALKQVKFKMALPIGAQNRTPVGRPKAHSTRSVVLCCIVPGIVTWLPSVSLK